MTTVISTSRLRHISAEECSAIMQRVYKDLPDVHITRLGDTRSIFPMLADPEFNADYVILDLDEVDGSKNLDIFELIHTLSTLIKCTVRRDNGKTVKRETTIVALAHDTTDVAKIKEAIEFKEIDYIIPGYGSSYTYDAAIGAFKEVLDGNAARINAIIKKRLAGDKKKKSDDKSIKLTPRQTQILNIINSRGASNKVIARMLNISESTVKLHIGAILKKYGVRNRTQLAIFSKQEAK